MISKLKGMVKYSDMFYSSQMLRFEEEQQYSTVTGGLLSLAIIITTIIGFASMILDTLDLSTITTSMELVKNDDPTLSTFTASPDQNFMFAAEVWLVNTTGTKRYFDVVLSQVIRSGETMDFYNLPLEPCTRAHWTLIPSLSDKFEKLNVGNWLCPPIGLNFTMYGKYSSNSTSSYALTVAGCKNATDPSRPCAPQQEIDQLFVAFESKFFFTVYYTNPIINPSQKEYKSYYLQDQTYVIFGNNIGSQGFIYFTDYTINTDYSIWPFQSIQTDQGVLVQNLAINHPYQTVKNGVYAQVFLSKSPNSITYTRQVQKITSVFSFIGGMISAASTVLFFVKAYTSFSFQISIASVIFKSKNEENDQNEGLKMNFFTFIKYSIYSILQKIGIPCNWRNYRYISECQAEITKQLDIKTIIKRFVFIQHCLTHIFEDFQLDILQMNTPSSLSQIKLIRQKCVSIIDYENMHEFQSRNDDLIEGVRKTNKHTDLHGNNLEVEGSACQESINSLCKHEIGNNSQPPTRNILVQDISLNKQYQIQISQCNRKKKTIAANSNMIDNNFKKSMIRQTNLHLLSLNSSTGNELSKKIWLSLSGQMKEKFGLNKICQKKQETSKSKRKVAFQK